jgi:signal transduction histidine kinase
MRVFWLAVLVVAIWSQLRDEPTHVQVGATLALVVAAAGWVAWPLALRRGRQTATVLSLASLGCSGAVVSLWAPLGVAFFAVAALAAAGAFDLPLAVAVGSGGPVLLAILVFATGGSWGAAIGGAASGLAGLAGGIGRRQQQEEHVQTAQLAVAREVHDVLAHTLAAVAVQLEAADAVLESGGDPAKLRTLLQRSRRLVGEGIEETRAAVRALRDEPVELVGRIEALVAAEPVELHVSGEPRALPPKAGLALYRAAQEALTNVQKHAPGAPTTLALEFREDDTVLRVDNGPATRPHVEGESGYGLQGMRERLELAGGHLDAGETEWGWSVEARVPV